MVNLQELQDAVISGNASKTKELTEQALKENVDPVVIVKEWLIPGMGIVGDKFKRNEIYVPEMLIAARAMYAALDVLRPILAQTDMEPVGKVVIGTVKGDLHDIGKNLVKMMLEGAGFEVIDLGIDVAPQKFVDAVKENKPNHVAMSALLTTTMPAMKETIEALKAAGLRDKVKVMIGGAPVTDKYANEIGADGYAPDASSAVDLAKRLLQ
ncbi:MAG TPA: cobalamin-binding protein [Firmicutes bacterium]|nr:cobalamin-binding protein [Bacillota bacterium]